MADLDSKTVMIVDDTPESLRVIHELLRPDYRTLVANSGEKALELVHKSPPQLILLDIMMPDMDGYQVCSALKSDPATRDIPVIFLTALTAPEDEVKGFLAGAVDFVTKPVCPPTLLARVKTQLTLSEARQFLADRTRILEEEVARRTREISMIQEATIVALGSLAETRDNETGNHIRRTQRYVQMLAQELRKNPRYAKQLGERQIEILYRSAALHDIGKVGIPDGILLKPGPLTAEEFETMKTHTVLGRDAIAAAEKFLEGESDFLFVAREIAYSHHEKWDGSGYPQGLVGEAIPLSARLMAVADVYDALISKRVYKGAMTHEETVEIIRAGRGKHFDPDVLDAFESLIEAFQSFAQELPG